jgi:ACS family hexuronate transporter-like MFS transporter
MSVTPASPAPGCFRWTICGLLFGSVALNYIDRNIIGILKQPLSDELRWSERDYAHIASAFKRAYAFGYLFGGRVEDGFEVKSGRPSCAVPGSLAAGGHGLVSLIALEARLISDPTWRGAVSSITNPA